MKKRTKYAKRILSGALVSYISSNGSTFSERDFRRGIVDRNKAGINADSI